MGTKNKASHTLHGGPYFHTRGSPIITVKIGTQDPQISGKMGTRVPIILVEWGSGIPIFGGPHFTLTPATSQRHSRTMDTPWVVVEVSGLIGTIEGLTARWARGDWAFWSILLHQEQVKCPRTYGRCSDAGRRFRYPCMIKKMCTPYSQGSILTKRCNQSLSVIKVPYVHNP